MIPNFEKASGIKINQTPFSQNEEQINKLQATGGEGFDLCSPTLNRAPQYKDLNVLAPFDTSKLTNASNILPSMMDGRQRALDMGRRTILSAALLGFRGDLLSHRPLQRRSDPTELWLALG